MTRSVRAMGAGGRRGQTLVEFAACSVLTLMMLLVVIEFGRMVLAYTTICNAARIGVRYAMVHGSNNSVSVTQVQSVVATYLGAAAIATGSAVVNVTYPGYVGASCAAGSKNPGCPVLVTVSYPYQTMVSYFPINVNLASQSRGVITF